MIPRLIVAGGKHRGRKIPIEEDIIILGTAAECDIRFTGDNVAPKHCQISKLGARLVLHDLVGGDRTLLNGKPVTQAELSHGDTLSVGGTLFRVALSGAPLPVPEDQSVSEELSRASEAPTDGEVTVFFERDEKAVPEAARQVAEAVPDRIVVAPSYQAELVRAMIDDLEARVPYYRGHSSLVAHVAVAIARRMHLPQAQVEAAYAAGLLHDFGQEVMPSDILAKEGALSADERLIVERHPVLAASKLQVKGIPFAVYNAVLTHHEQPDGQGYPVGIRRGAVEPLALVLHTAEVYVALTSDRPHRRALGDEPALDEMRRAAVGEFSTECFTALEALATSEILSDMRSTVEAANTGRAG